MEPVSKNKVLTWLVILLVIANAVTITIFWLNRKEQRPPSNPAPVQFLINELKLDKTQQEKLMELVREHRSQVELIRKNIKAAKDSLFGLIKNDQATDSMKQLAADAASKLTSQIDVLTVNHFQKVRNICTPEQQKKFDDIILEVTSMMGPRPPQRPGNPGPPPNERPGGDGPPPPGSN
jgi:Spy/CpxP family protein refolding chaperone